MLKHGGAQLYLTFEKWRQEGREFKAIMGYIKESLCYLERSCLKKWVGRAHELDQLRNLPEYDNV